MVCLWIYAASAEYDIAAFFAKRAVIFPNVPPPHFHRKSLDYGTLQDGTLSGSAAHTEG